MSALRAAAPQHATLHAPQHATLHAPHRAGVAL
jgi:hypothetical protein